MHEDMLGALTTALAERVVSEIRSSSVYVPQKGSPLGPRRHINAVKRRMVELPEAEWECAKVDKNYYLTPKGLRQELIRFAMGKGPGDLAKVRAEAPPKLPTLDAGARMLAEIRRMRGA